MIISLNCLAIYPSWGHPLSSEMKESESTDWDLLTRSCRDACSRRDKGGRWGCRAPSRLAPLSRWPRRAGCPGWPHSTWPESEGWWNVNLLTCQAPGEFLLGKDNNTGGPWTCECPGAPESVQFVSFLSLVAECHLGTVINSLTKPAQQNCLLPAEEAVAGRCVDNIRINVQALILRHLHTTPLRPLLLPLQSYLRNLALPE